LPENIEPHTTSILPGRCASPDIFLFISGCKDTNKRGKYHNKIKKTGLKIKNCVLKAAFFIFFVILSADMGILYIVPTPVGNMEDMTFRAVRILKEVDLVLAEDTRTSGILLKHYEIRNQLMSHHKFNEHGTSAAIVNRLLAGENVALISDAGTPGISDPGFFLVREAVRAGVEVQCLPGATAFVPALVSSGLPCDRFAFEGFLPQKKGRQTKLQSLVDEERTMIFYESPYRLVKTLQQFAETYGADRQVSVCREISKVHEESVRGTLEEVIAHFKAHEPKGEIVIVLAGRN
jgi:16S rRNA (cytidine1402-2'-O)-methyltransferase